jgi:hypothetical protein
MRAKSTRAWICLDVIEERSKITESNVLIHGVMSIRLCVHEKWSSPVHHHFSLRGLDKAHVGAGSIKLESMSQMKYDCMIKACVCDPVMIDEDVFGVVLIVAKESSSSSVSRNLDQVFVPNELRNLTFVSGFKDWKIQSKLCRGAWSRCFSNELDEWLTE